MNDVWDRARRAGGGEDDDRCAPSGRGGRSSFLNMLIIWLNTVLHLSSNCKDAVDWCRSSQYGCMDGHSWLEWDVIVSGCRVYLLIDNDGRGGIGYLYSLQWSVVKPDGEDESGGEKDGTGCQG